MIDSKFIEKLEVLSGDRLGPRDNAATRIVDFADLLELDKFQSTELTAAPTMADFNTLVRDVKRVSETLNAVALALTKRKARIT